MIKRVIILFVIFSLCFCSIAFADDLEPDSSGSSSSANDRLATEEEIQALDNAISEASHNLALLMASGDSVRATDYEQATYNLLSSVFGSSTSSWASIVATRLGYLYTINSSANSIVVKLTGFYNSINPDYDTTGISMYDVAHGILTALTTIDPNDGDLTIIETLVYIHTALQDLDTDLTAILNSTYSIDAKLVNINTAIIQFKSDILTSISSLNTDMNTGFTNVNANMATIISRLQSMQNDYNNVVWSTLNSYDIYNGNNDTVISSTSTYNNIYFRFTHSIYNDSVVYKITLPIISYIPNRFDKIFDLSITVGSTTVDSFSYNYEFDSYGKLTLYISDLSFNNILYSSIPTIHIKPTNPAYFYIQSDYKANVYFIDSNNIDFYTVYNWLHNRNVNNIFSKFEMLYASDDLIDSKEAQQPLEDQIISDFTGNGSASASVGDAVNVKQASNAIKNGLNTGANSGVALDYAFGFNNPSGLFVWFSSDTAQYFTLYQPTRGISDYSDIEWTDELPDHLSILDYKYQQGLNND